MRKSGILMHISSLPSDYGIGTMGKEAYKFVDFLKSAKQKCWQILADWPDKLRRFAVSVVLNECRQSVFYRYGYFA